MYEFNANIQSGLDFDSAVTTVNVAETEKGVKAGLKIRVVGTDIEKSTTSSSSQPVTSRIKFNVSVVY
jgi:hypothetical protein